MLHMNWQHRLPSFHQQVLRQKLQSICSNYRIGSLIEFDHDRRHVGLLTVEVIEARGLKKYDVLGKSDPFIELSTQPLSKEKTAVKKKTLTPSWNETKHVLVQVSPGRLAPVLCSQS